MRGLKPQKNKHTNGKKKTRQGNSHNTKYSNKMSPNYKKKYIGQGRNG